MEKEGGKRDGAVLSTLCGNNLLKNLITDGEIIYCVLMHISVVQDLQNILNKKSGVWGSGEHTIHVDFRLQSHMRI